MRDADTSIATPAVAERGTGSVVVYFDLDHTLIDTSSGLLYYQYLWRLGEVGPLDVARASWWILLYRLNRLDVEMLAHREMKRYTGREEAPVREQCGPWFEEYVQDRIYADAVDTVARHKADGHHCALLSAASPYVCEPMQRHLDMDATICTRLVIEDGCFTGEIEPPYCYGAGKIARAERHAAAHGFDLQDAYFYSDSYSDLPMLERVGHPHIVNPDTKLRAAARAHGWPILAWTHAR